MTIILYNIEYLELISFIQLSLLLGRKRNVSLRKKMFNSRLYSINYQLQIASRIDSLQYWYIRTLALMIVKAFYFHSIALFLFTLYVLIICYSFQHFVIQGLNEILPRNKSLLNLRKMLCLHIIILRFSSLSKHSTKLPKIDDNFMRTI